MRRGAARVVLLLALAVANPAVAQGYRVLGDRVEVDARHMEAWQYPMGAVTFFDGTTRPRLVRDQSDAISDARLFTGAAGVPGGIRAAGSNPGGAAAILDGDRSTWWEPDLDDGLNNWWVEIDLGRAVWARKVVVHFADELDGDPFLQFKVLTSDGSEAFLQSSAFAYNTAGRSDGLNKTQRTFEFNLQTAVAADPDFAGDIIQYVQIVVTASAGGRAQRVGEPAWNALSQGKRGDVVHFRDDGGRLREIDRDEYEALDESRRGPVHYYRRELPRLADIEVWTAGDNVSLGTVDRGGRIQGYGNLGAEVLTIDGDFRSFWSVEVGYNVFGFGTGGVVELGIQDPNREVFLDLGSWFWVDRMLIVFDRKASGGAFPNYVINLSDGRRSPDGSLLFVPVAQRGDGGLDHVNRGRYLQHNEFPLQRARFVRLDYHVVESSIRSNIKEIMLHGQGYQPQVTLTSDMIELGTGTRILGAIRWDAEVPPGTQLRVRTRSGNEVGQRITYYTNLGTEVTEEKYRSLLSFQRGDSLVTAIPGPDWSSWSQFYAAPGATITSPSPRRFVMAQATLVTEDPDQSVRLHGLEIDLRTPLATQILGEVGPRRVSLSGVPDTLTVFLKPTVDGSSRGFDQVRLAGPPGSRLTPVDLRIYEEADSLAADRLGLAELEVMPSTADSIWLRLPAPVRDERIIALRFGAELFLASNPFAVEVGLGETDETTWQRVDADDATDLVEGAGMSVFTPFDGGILGPVSVQPNPMTPNGDGINDVAVFEFPVYKVQGSKELVLEIFGLDGRRVAERREAVEFTAGLHRLTWDGRGDAGRLVPPGMYLARIRINVDAHNQKVEALLTIAVVY